MSKTMTLQQCVIPVRVAALHSLFCLQSVIRNKTWKECLNAPDHEELLRKHWSDAWRGVMSSREHQAGHSLPLCDASLHSSVMHKGYLSQCSTAPLHMSGATAAPLPTSPNPCLLITTDASCQSPKGLYFLPLLRCPCTSLSPVLPLLTTINNSTPMTFFPIASNMDWSGPRFGIWDSII